MNTRTAASFMFRSEKRPTSLPRTGRITVTDGTFAHSGGNLINNGSLSINGGQYALSGGSFSKLPGRPEE